MHRNLLREIEAFNKAKLKHIDNSEQTEEKSQQKAPLDMIRQRRALFRESSSSDSDSVEFSDYAVWDNKHSKET